MDLKAATSSYRACTFCRKAEEKGQVWKSSPSISSPLTRSKNLCGWRISVNCIASTACWCSMASAGEIRVSVWCFVGKNVQVCYRQRKVDDEKSSIFTYKEVFLFCKLSLRMVARISIYIFRCLARKNMLAILNFAKLNDLAYRKPSMICLWVR